MIGNGTLRRLLAGRAQGGGISAGGEGVLPSLPPLAPALYRRREAFLAAALAVASAELLRLAVPVGIDTAAQLYQTGRFLHSGFQFWDNYWYDGRYTFVDYSLLYFPIASLIGEVPTVMATLAASGYLFARLVAGRFGVSGRWPVRAFACCAGIVVWISGEYPFALGMALGLAALSLRNHRKLPLAGLAALASLLASPLAFLLLAVTVVGIAFGAGQIRRLLRPDVLIGLALCAVAGGVMQLAFPIPGAFHYSGWALFQVLALAAIAFAASWRLKGVGMIRGLFAAMALTAIASFVVESPLGGNATRLADYVAGPLILILLSRQLKEGRIGRRVAGVVGAVALCGQLAPNLVTASLVLSVKAAEPVFWRGAIAFLRAHYNPNYRVEAVDTSGHWEAYYLPAAGIPIVRGWFRQDDFPDNAILYRKRIAPGEYRDWLRRSAVDYVVLPHTTLDYSSKAEAALLASGRSGLRVVYTNPFTTIYELPHPSPLLIPPAGAQAGVIHFGHASLELYASRPGDYRLAINYTPYWHSEPAGAACITEDGQPGLSTLIVYRPGTVWLRFDPTIPQLFSSRPASCPLP